MFVKIIRAKSESRTARTLVYEPIRLEFVNLDKDIDYPKGATEELFMHLDEINAEQIILFAGDEVWLTSDSGQTVDRWKI